MFLVTIVFLASIIFVAGIFFLIVKLVSKIKKSRTDIESKVEDPLQGLFIS